jgi:predicted CXXCH cytochrome family protein
MTASPDPPQGQPVLGKLLVIAALFAGAGALFILFRPAPRSETPPPVVLPKLPHKELQQPPRRLAAGRRLSVWWDTLPDDLLARSRPAGQTSNIHPSNYTGPESCKSCHQRNYETWSVHPHRWMNAPVSEAAIKGDFSESTALSYRGGQATFRRRGDAYFMHLQRGGVRRTYRVTQTIGSRFFQYYVGKLVEGPEPPDHHFYHKDHVLPFGYWLDQKEWIPTVHIGSERPDEDRPDPFEPPEKGAHYAEYAVGCNYCHTTFPLGDLFGRRPQLMGEYAPVQMHWSVRSYLEKERPDDLRTVAPLMTGKTMQNPMADWDAAHYAATFGVSCEACHLGAREHVRSGGKVMPRFFPSSPHLVVEGGSKLPDQGRSHDNVNWACGRCHTGGRPAFAAGMSTWNSVEYSDAMRGSCYSELRCVDCHNPHRALGPKWTRTPDQDDAQCLKCHKQFRPAEQRLAHTHHPAGSEGARCLNCHMPRINEGLQDVVRTHMIYSPTRADMIEANHPNACNLCHTDQPIDWTLRHLKDWYGKGYDSNKIAAHYPERARPVALGWLRSDNEAVRLVAADALTRSGGKKVLPELLEALDDPYLLNRQFTARGLQDRLGLRLADFGYRFYMTRAERRGPLAELRKRCLGATGEKKR